MKGDAEYNFGVKNACKVTAVCLYIKESKLDQQNILYRLLMY